MEDRKAAIERVKKLLNVTRENGASEAEAVRAALMAQRIMAANGIGEGDLADGAEPIVEASSKRSRPWQTDLAAVVAENFRCRVFVKVSGRSGRSVVFYGYEADAEAARLVYERLSKAGNGAGMRYARRRAQLMSIREGREVPVCEVFNAWAAAFVLGVADELSKQSRELMVVCPKAVGDAFEEMTAGWGTERRRARMHGDGATARDGRQSGRDSVRAGRIGAGGTPALPA